MESIRIKNLTFTYSDSDTPALSDISLNIDRGEFVTVCGKSGCGKSTFLRQLKPSVLPYGDKAGTVHFDGADIAALDLREECKKIGFVAQNPDTQIVTDKVWHELAFGLESLGKKTAEIRARVAEMASFFGIQTWFHKNTNELSGGQKQLLNLAAVMVMQPELLLLDEPTSRLDPIAAGEFLGMVSKINRELGVTVILTEHRLEDALPLSDRMIVLDSGRIIADAAPSEAGRFLREHGNDMFFAMPAAMRIYAAVDGKGSYPVTVRDGRTWLLGYSDKHELRELCAEASAADGEKVMTADGVFFRYGKKSDDVLKGFNIAVRRGELYAVMGGNGAGKTTALSVLAGLYTPHRGRITSKGCVAMLPQDPQTLFVKKTVSEDLSDMLADKDMSTEEKDKTLNDVISLCGLDALLERHPYDLSGGEQQRAALAKILMLKPDILLLDEPTKGIDAYFKARLARILKRLTASGVTVIMVSHDTEFCAAYADRCALLFDGMIVSEGTARSFFSGNSFYTTAANRIARGYIDNAITADDVIYACGVDLEIPDDTYELPKKKTENSSRDIKPEPKLFSGILFAVLFLVFEIYFSVNFTDWYWTAAQGISLLLAWLSLRSFFPPRTEAVSVDKSHKKKPAKSSVIAASISLIAVPFTIYAGIRFFDDRKYYFISLLIIFEILLPFMLAFEGRRPHARELIIISVLSAVAVIGRVAFYMLPQFKPSAAIVIIAGVCFGGEAGFLTGAVTGFVSNMFFGQGPWTPWQMFALGLMGFFAGIFFHRGHIKASRSALCIFGATAAIVVYGGIMNLSSALMAAAKPDWHTLALYYAAGLQFDIIHAVSTAFFLWFASEPMIEKITRIKKKYGLLQQGI